MKNLFLFIGLVLVALGAWWYFSGNSAVLDYSAETPEEVASALDSVEVVDLDKELSSLNSDIEGL